MGDLTSEQCSLCVAKVPINDVGEHYEHKGWLHDVRTPYFPRQTFKFTSCPNWRPSAPYPSDQV